MSGVRVPYHAPYLGNNMKEWNQNKKLDMEELTVLPQHITMFQQALLNLLQQETLVTGLPRRSHKINMTRVAKED